MISHQEITSENKKKTSTKKKFQYKLIGTLVFALAVILSLVLLIVLETNKSPSTKRCLQAHEVYQERRFHPVSSYSKYAVAADSKECSTIGRKILDRGGSAVDSAIATALCNGVLNAQSMGIGGGHFMTIYKKNENKSYTIDAREVAPGNSFKEMFVKNTDKALFGGLASGIPGEIKGYYEAHKIGGKLPWKDLFQPTIDLCIKGFNVTRALAGALSNKKSLIRENKMLASIFINPETNDVYTENNKIKMPNLGMTLKIISESGSDAFYDGILTDLIVQEINENGGNVTREDFKNYRARVHENRFMIKLSDKLRVYTPPPPSSGILVAFILKLMSGYELKDTRLMDEEESALFYHRLLESFKHAYAKRTILGDEKFLNSTALEKIYEELQNESYINQIRLKINDEKTFSSSYYGAEPRKWDHGTAHISVLDGEGDAVSITSTVNNYFGGKYAGKYTGIIYNDIMDDFSTPGLTNSFGFAPSSANYIEPFKRPMSSMSPIVVVDNNDDVVLALGASGGSKIISSISQIALQVLFMDTNIKDAIDHRRVHHQLYPEYAQIEAEFSEPIQNDLRKIGHDIQCFNFGGSVNQGIQRKNNIILAYSDPRKGGEPDGI